MNKGSKILIVEDELVLQLMLAHMLKRMGYTDIEKTSRGTEAVELGLKHNFDLILMDIMLQDKMDGIDAYSKIKMAKGPVPVIYITGNTDPKNKERAQDLGFHEYLGKPLTFAQLKRSIETIDSSS